MSRKHALGKAWRKEMHRTVYWDPKKTAIIICDMWDDHTCRGAADRVAEMAPAMNRQSDAGARHQQRDPHGSAHQYLRLWSALRHSSNGVSREERCTLP